MNGFAKRVTQDELAAQLQRLFPVIDGLDFAVVAEELVAAVDLRAVTVIGERETGFQKALQAVMEYYRGLLDTYDEERAKWEEERKALHLRLLASTKASDV